MGFLGMGGDPYGAGAYKSAYNTDANGVRTAAGVAGDVANDQGNLYRSISPSVLASFNKSMDLLNRNPLDSSFRASQLAPGYEAADAATTAGKSQLQSDLAARGLDTSSSAGPSSQLVGGLTNLYANNSATKAGIANTVGQYDLNLPLQRAEEAYNLSNGFGQQTLGNEMSANGQSGNLYGNVAGMDANMYQTAQQADSSLAQGEGAALGGLMSLPGTFAGLGMTKNLLKAGSTNPVAGLGGVGQTMGGAASATSIPTTPTFNARPIANPPYQLHF